MNMFNLQDNPWLVAIIVLWSLVWAGIALWESARRGDKKWFIVFLVVHTLGILEMIYIFFVTDDKKKKKRMPTAKPASIAKV